MCLRWLLWLFVSQMSIECSDLGSRCGQSACLNRLLFRFFSAAAPEGGRGPAHRRFLRRVPAASGEHRLTGAWGGHTGRRIGCGLKIQ